MLFSAVEKVLHSCDDPKQSETTYPCIFFLQFYNIQKDYTCIPFLCRRRRQTQIVDEIVTSICVFIGHKTYILSLKSNHNSADYVSFITHLGKPNKLALREDTGTPLFCSLTLITINYHHVCNMARSGHNSHFRRDFKSPFYKESWVEMFPVFVWRAKHVFLFLE